MSQMDQLEDSLKNLTLQAIDQHPTKSREQFALEFFQLGSEKESIGKLDDAANYYRKAYKIDSSVDKKYREKLMNELPVPEVRRDGSVLTPFKKLDLSKIKVGPLLKSFENSPIYPQDDTKPVYLDLLPDEILVEIMEILVHIDTPAWFEFARSCKRLAYLGFHESTIWRSLCNLIYPNQCYNKESIQLNNIKKDQTQMVSIWDNSWHKMLLDRPFIKFNGIYISVVTYQREGGRSEGSTSWNNPLRIITYYRYYRFFPDGTSLKLLTVLEPKKVVPKFHKNWRELFGKSEWERVYEGRWSISLDGIIVIESEGPVNFYEMIEEFQIINGGRFSKHHKLSWLSMKARHRETKEDSHLDFANERNFVFSRVRSYYTKEEEEEEENGEERKEKTGDVEDGEEDTAEPDFLLNNDEEESSSEEE